MKPIKDKFEKNLIRLIDDNILEIVNTEYYLKREGIENRKSYSEKKFLNMLKNSIFPFEDGLSYLFLPLSSDCMLRIFGGENDPYYDKVLLMTIRIKDGYTKAVIEKELDKAMVIDLSSMKNRKRNS